MDHLQNIISSKLTPSWTIMQMLLKSLHNFFSYAVNEQVRKSENMASWTEVKKEKENSIFKDSQHLNQIQFPRFLYL